MSRDQRAKDLMKAHPGMKYTEALAVTRGERELAVVLRKVRERVEAHDRP